MKFLSLFIIFIMAACSSFQIQEQGLSNDVTKISASNSCEHTETAFHCVKVVEVYDGDTIFVDISGQHPLFGKRMGVRFDGVDTPEIRTKNACEKKKAKKVKAIIEELISKSSRIDIVNIGKDKFFRILGTVLVDGKSLSDELITRSLAFPYHGEKKLKRNWCL